jgi:phosphoglycolate phosphatase-like HAD superfamily hydrolase
VPYFGRMRPLPGGGQLGRGDRPARLSVVLATSAKDDEVGLMLDAWGAGAAIGTVASSRSVERAKPGRSIVERALGESGTNRAHAVMVGETVWDVIAARRAAVPCIGLLSGGIAREPLPDAGAVEVYAGVAALLDKLGQRNWPSGQRSAP